MILNYNLVEINWILSKKDSFREKYVKQLSEFIDVDIYGDCGKFKCPRNKEHWLSDPDCYVHLAAKYKFYLSFENSICIDYVTEKFFSILHYDMVPVVMGGANYTAIAPPHSFIDALEFEGPKELADYLNLLDQDDRLYREYFEWKQEFIVESGVDQMARHAFCDLCEKLHRPESQETDKFYSSLVPFYGRETQCKSTWKSSLKMKG